MGQEEKEELFRIIGGDGDQSYLTGSVILKRVRTGRFSGEITDWGDAMHFVIVGGGHAGEHIALTPRTMVPLEEDISTNGWASVIVHVIKNPSPSFNESKDIDHIGMAVVELVKS